ncbi:MAG: bifunctional folylpolyglutamate synthase/dihydrofolate synthase, partial [Pelagibacteraceae bacterium]|nr:bifunctional folylpolyglutamate synthase/dihydrofolate synthase [Pelagibacteraceae bacterium]
MNSLKNLLEELEGLHPKYIDLSLTRIEKLLKKLNNPHLKLPKCIHIAGTNGKGSTLSFIKNILIESNLKVHAYTSPHLEKINERFIIANKIISNKKLFEYLKYIKKINANKPITFYEITTAAAFYMFSKNYADVLILETGLGGRLDATNIIKNNLISIITKIGYDHQEYLGKSIKKITKEKLGIIKKGSIIINAKQSQIVNQEIKKYTQINKNKILSYESDWKIINTSKDYFYIKKNNNIKTMYPKPNLNGEHQLYNLSTAIITSEYLKKLGYRIH